MVQDQNKNQNSLLVKNIAPVYVRARVCVGVGNVQVNNFLSRCDEVAA